MFPGVQCYQICQKKSPNIKSGDNYQVHLPLPYSEEKESIPVILFNFIELGKQVERLNHFKPLY